MPLHWDTEGGFQRQTTLRPGQSVEVCGKLPAQTRVKWSFSASAPLESNVHYHEGERVVYPARHEARTTHPETLQLPVAQEYCWMWSNRGGRDAALELRLHR
ncbi:MAG: hypothetical protein HYZ17_05340 [Betaproteobacteria bacterium]|nr:hypothetical protein [Betaproteobacteria bacterium]